SASFPRPSRSPTSATTRFGRAFSPTPTWRRCPPPDSRSRRVRHGPSPRRPPGAAASGAGPTAPRTPRENSPASPATAAPGGSGQNCSSTGCVVDLNGACPSDLKVVSEAGEGVACKSACEAFRQPQYCCDGAYATPDTCKPTSYSLAFKNACPRAYSYAYDDKTSTFTCSSADYAITFCPTPSTSQKASQGQNQGTTTMTSPPPPGITAGGNDGRGSSPFVDGSMVYEGGELANNGGAATTCTHVGAAVSITLAVWRLMQFF
ncbi:unnamed protein product, partial [Linum tenue]